MSVKSSNCNCNLYKCQNRYDTKYNEDKFDILMLREFSNTFMDCNFIFSNKMDSNQASAMSICVILYIMKDRKTSIKNCCFCILRLLSGISTLSLTSFHITVNISFMIANLTTLHWKSIT